MGLRIVVGGDSAGLQYKEALRKDLEADERVDSVEDVGVMESEDETMYPNVAVAAG
jgi:ribose 5-phosphate isomerase B